LRDFFNDGLAHKISVVVGFYFLSFLRFLGSATWLNPSSSPTQR